MTTQIKSITKLCKMAKDQGRKEAIEEVEKIIDKFAKKKIKYTRKWEQINLENIPFLEEIDNYNEQLKQQLKELKEKSK